MKTPVPVFPGIKKPSLDFSEVRDGRRASLFYYDVDLSVASSISAATALQINLSGNSIYIDNDQGNVGTATLHFQDTNLGASSAPVLVGPGFIAKVPFTQLLVENTAQPGKRLRIFYGTDVDFVPGTNYAVANTSTVGASPANTQITVTNVSQQFLAANSSRQFLLIQNNDAAGDIFVRFGAASTLATGVKIAAGVTTLFDAVVPRNAVHIIGSIASNANCVIVEG